jgi:hypothetical protein
MAGGPTDPKLIGFPLFTITDFDALGDGSNLPVHFTVNDSDTADTVTWVKGTHVMKFGAGLLHVQFYQPYNNNNRGTYNFTGSWTGQPYADFLLGCHPPHPGSSERRTIISSRMTTASSSRTVGGARAG